MEIVMKRGFRRKRQRVWLVGETLENRRMLAVDLGMSVVSAPAAVSRADPVVYQVEVANLGTQSVATDVLHAQSGLRDVTWRREVNFGDVNTGNIRDSMGFQFQGSQSLEGVGSSIHSAGDVNGDGYADFVVGATGLFRDLAVSNDFIGGAYVVFGSNESPSPGGKLGILEAEFIDGTNGFQLRGFEQVDSHNVGIRVSGGRDINGDGFDDVIIGAPVADQAGDGRGEAYVVFGAEEFPLFMNLNELDGTNGFTILGESTDDRAGESVALVDDINGDGIDDVVVGAPGRSDNLEIRGAAYIVYGRTSFDQFVELADLEASEGFAVYGPANGFQLGHDVAGAGDVNADGIADLLVASRKQPSTVFPPVVEPDPDAEAYLIFGSRVGFAGLNITEIDGSDGVRFNDGIYVDAAGDFNGDGIDDLLVANSLVFGSRDWPSEIDLDELNGISGIAIPTDSMHDFSASGLGDANGDGLDDIIVGRRRDSWIDPTNSMAEQQGRAYVVFGGENVPSPINLDATDEIGFRINGQYGDDRIANDVSEAGDLNGDGVADFLVAGGLGRSREGVGIVYAVYGRESVGMGLGDGQDAIVLAPGETATYLISGVALPGISEASIDVVLDIRDVEDEDTSNNSVHVTTQIVDAIAGDINLDGKVEFADFLILSSNFGKEIGATRSEGDLNGDSAIDFADFLILSANFR